MNEKPPRTRFTERLKKAQRAQLDREALSSVRRRIERLAEDGDTPREGGGERMVQDTCKTTDGD